VAMLVVVVVVVKPLNGNTAAECNDEGKGGMEEGLPVLAMSLLEGGRRR